MFQLPIVKINENLENVVYRLVNCEFDWVNYFVELIAYLEAVWVE